MRRHHSAGRPRAVSRDMLEEAACELFLEQGYDATSVADITRRAGVSRATFFNYIPSKSDLLWTSIDAALDQLDAELELELGAELAEWEAADPVAQSRAGLERLAARLEPGTVVLAFANAEPMGVIDELTESAGRRHSRAAEILARHLRRHGIDGLRAEVIGSAQAGALLAALRHWSCSSPGQTSFPSVLETALNAVH